MFRAQGCALKLTPDLSRFSINREIIRELPSLAFRNIMIAFSLDLTSNLKFFKLVHRRFSRWRRMISTKRTLFSFVPGKNGKIEFLFSELYSAKKMR
jgi:hypothetical protein